MLITVLFVLHGLCAITLLGAITHQATSVAFPPRVRGTHFVTRFRSVSGPGYVNAVIVLFLVTFVLGAIVYPTYRITTRVYLEDLKMGSAVGAFEMKEHIISFALGLLPAYWYFWRQPLAPEHASARRWVTIVMALFVWTSFLIGHVLNNIRGV